MVKELSRQLGLRVRQLREHKEMTQEDLATKAGITWHFVSSIERGIKTGTLETLAAIAAALDVTLSELFLDVDRPLPRESNRITTALAGRSPEVQRAVLRIVEDALHLAALK
jgi:transcriptional regulator with XRE-family HTH domain